MYFCISLEEYGQVKEQSATKLDSQYKKNTKERQTNIRNGSTFTDNISIDRHSALRSVTKELLKHCGEKEADKIVETFSSTEQHGRQYSGESFFTVGYFP